jgi:hypothetical protein
MVSIDHATIPRGVRNQSFSHSANLVRLVIREVSTQGGASGLFLEECFISSTLQSSARPKQSSIMATASSVQLSGSVRQGQIGSSELLFTAASPSSRDKNVATRFELDFNRFVFQLTIGRLAWLILTSPCHLHLFAFTRASSFGLHR